MRVLVAGWFSFRDMGNTAGDMIACDVVCDWLFDAGVSFDIALSESLKTKTSVEWEKADPLSYTDLLFVCGPFGNGWPLTDTLERFNNCRIIGVNLTLLQTYEDWNPFTLIYERDSSVTANPDISFSGPPPKIPVVGIILIGQQDEYGDRDLHKKANQFIEKFINNHELSVVRIDTVIDNNQGGLRTPGEIESLIARMDVVLTTRLHGTVLSIKNGVPVIPIDPVAGGAKISRQVKTFDWPILINSDNLQDKVLADAFDFCLTEQARLKAKECAQNANRIIENIRIKFIREIKELPS